MSTRGRWSRRVQISGCVGPYSWRSWLFCSTTGGGVKAQDRGLRRTSTGPPGVGSPWDQPSRAATGLPTGLKDWGNDKSASVPLDLNLFLEPNVNHGLGLFDGSTDDTAPLGPGTVVVADIPKPQELGQDEPRVGRALADPAVGNGLSATVDALSTVQSP